MVVLAIGSFGLLLYTWIIYPLGIRAISWQRRQGPGSEDARSVSVILATREPDDLIARRVLNLRDTAYRGRVEVIVACDAQRPGGLAVTPPGGGVLLVMGDGPGGKAGALNAGVRAATGDVLVFADTGQAFNAETIPALLSMLGSDPHFGAVSGALEIASREAFSVASWYWRYERWLRGHEARVHSAVGVTGAVYAMPRTLWTPLPPGLILDDLFTPMQLALRGLRIGFASGAIARDDRTFVPDVEYRRKARTLTGVLQLCAWLPAVLHPGRNPIWLQFVSHKLLRLLTPYLLVGTVVGTVGVAAARAPDTTLRLLTAGALGSLLLLMVSQRLRAIAWGGWLMQLAILRATWNAARGDWDVWRN